MKKRISVTLDKHTVDLLEQKIKKGGQSEFVNEAILEKIYMVNIQEVEQKNNLFKKVKKIRNTLKNTSTQTILNNIDRGKR